MIIRFPSFYEEFACIGGACKKSCCIDWELDVDSETYEYYKTVPGDFGERLRAELRSLPEEEGEESHCFLLPENGRCPFLNDKNLCDIVLELGDEALCDICGSYPRYSFSYGNVLEKSLSVSCEEVARLLFSEKDGIKFTEIETLDEYDGEYLSEEDFSDDSFDGEDFREPDSSEIEEFENYKWELFSGLQNRDTSLISRINAVMDIDSHMDLHSKEERLRILSLLEPIDSEWVDSLTRLQENTKTTSIPFKDDLYENLLIYFLFRYLPRGLYDGDISGKIHFALFCLFCVRDLEEIYGDVALAASAFSREVEHSEENIDLLMEELLFN